MADPRFSEAIRASKRLLDQVQDGLNKNTDQYETDRRRRFDGSAKVEAIESGSSAPKASGGGSGGTKGAKGDPGDAGGPDRLHKWGSRYVTVSNLHAAGQDAPLNPAEFSTIASAYSFAQTTLLPAIGPTERIVIIIIGGKYNESLSAVHPRIDFVGIGEPEWFGITAALTVAPLAHIFIEGIKFIGPTAQPAMSSQAAVRVKDCTFIPTGGAPALVQVGRGYYDRCMFFGDTNDVLVELVRVQRPGIETDIVKGWVRFTRCDFAARKTGPIFPAWGKAIQVGIPGVLQPITPNTLGVSVEDCNVRGWVQVDGSRYVQRNSPGQSGLLPYCLVASAGDQCDVFFDQSDITTKAPVFRWLNPTNPNDPLARIWFRQASHLNHDGGIGTFFCDTTTPANGGLLQVSKMETSANLFAPAGTLVLASGSATTVVPAVLADLFNNPAEF